MKAKKASKIIDRLEREVSFAKGLAALVYGLECMAESDHTGAWELARVHIERLQAFSADLATALRK